MSPRPRVRSFLHPRTAPLSRICPWFRRGDVFFLPYSPDRGPGEIVRPATLGELLDLLTGNAYPDYPSYEQSLTDDDRDPGHADPLRQPAVFLPREHVAQAMTRWREQAMLSLREAGTGFSLMAPVDAQSFGFHPVMPQYAIRLIASLERGKPLTNHAGYIAGLALFYGRPLGDLVVSRFTLANYVRTNSRDCHTIQYAPDTSRVPDDLRKQCRANAALYIQTRTMELLQVREDARKKGVVKGHQVHTQTGIDKIKQEAREELMERLKREGRLGTPASIPTPALPPSEKYEIPEHLRPKEQDRPNFEKTDEHDPRDPAFLASIFDETAKKIGS